MIIKMVNSKGATISQYQPTEEEIKELGETVRFFLIAHPNGKVTIEREVDNDC